jgi:hypothetical protein
MLAGGACLLAALLSSLLIPVARAQTVRLIRFSEGSPFQMGEVTCQRIVHPGIGVKKTTLTTPSPNLEPSSRTTFTTTPMTRFWSCKVKWISGKATRCGVSKPGECAFVPTGQIHGTIMGGTGEAIMISFQNPPDLILYTGARDSKKPGAAPPNGVITPGAVKFLNFDGKNGLVTFGAMGSERAAFAYRKLKSSETLKTRVDAGEQVLFVLKGLIQIKDAAGSYLAGEKDTLPQTVGFGKRQSVPVSGICDACSALLD